jgi:hypothetical protein
MADRLRAPGLAGDPLAQDDYVAVVPRTAAAARQPPELDGADLNFADVVVAAPAAVEPEDAGLLRSLGLPTAADGSRTPVHEFEYQYGLMAGFPDRDVDEGAVEAGARAAAARFDRALGAREAATRDAAYDSETVAQEEDDDDAAAPQWEQAEPAAAPGNGPLP